MTDADFRLEARFHPATDGSFGTMELVLVNLSALTLSGFVLAYSALTRVRDETSISGGTLVRRIGNFHEIACPDGEQLAPGDSWNISILGLSHTPLHRLDGPKSAYLTLANGERSEVAVGDLKLVGGADTGELKYVTDGQVKVPLSVVPWPQEISVGGLHERPPALCPAPDTALEHAAAMGRIAELSSRLFPDAPGPFVLSASSSTLALSFSRNERLAADGYRIEFEGSGVVLSFGGDAGRDYGLITLAQIRHGAVVDRRRFGVPAEGMISDTPRHGWRGCHLDVSRHFWPVATVSRLLDILAWNKMNVLQWHLTDDEGWRLEIKAIPELTRIGARRGADTAMVPQGAGGAGIHEGFYTHDDVADLVAHATSLHIDIVPEIDIPGHCTAVLHSLPHLRDPDEPADSYHSIQGYPNNALNPAMPETYRFLETVFDEVASLFPSPYIHVGGDEVDNRSWLASPLARQLMAAEGLAGTADLQAYLLRKAGNVLTGLGKKLAGWDEVADGGGVGRTDSLLVAWQNKDKIRALIEDGYDVVASPGQAYYLDMVQASGWDEPGTSWAGPSTPRACYEYEAVGELPASQAHHLKGVQAAIWSEHMVSRQLINHMVFPRLSAIAEAGWTEQGNKDWLRFAALSRLMPKL